MHWFVDERYTYHLSLIGHSKISAWNHLERILNCGERKTVNHSRHMVDPRTGLIIISSIIIIIMFITMNDNIQVCGCVCMHVFMYVYMRVCIYVCMYVCMRVSMYVCMHACMHGCVYDKFMCVCMFNVWMYVCMYECLYVCMYVRVHSCAHVCMYATYV